MFRFESLCWISPPIIVLSGSAHIKRVFEAWKQVTGVISSFFFLYEIHSDIPICLHWLIYHKLLQSGWVTYMLLQTIYSEDSNSSTAVLVCSTKCVHFTKKGCKKVFFRGCFWGRKQPEHCFWRLLRGISTQSIIFSKKWSLNKRKVQLETNKTKFPCVI